MTNIDLYYITRSFTSPHNEPQRSPGFVQKQPLEVFCKKAVLKNFANLTVKHLPLRPGTLLKRDSNTNVFLFASPQNNMTNSSDEFPLDKTLAEFLNV